MSNELLKKYNHMLVQKNEVMNLTAHKSEEASFKNNIEDSLLFVDFFRGLGKASVLDLGSGGGCPAVPLGISCPELKITMLDSTNKKIEFLKGVIAELELDNLSAVHDRIEDYASKIRGQFDIVTARAVAELPTLLEYALPLLKVGGLLLAFKGRNINTEIEASARALSILGAEIIEVKTAALCDDVTRSLVIIKKIRDTDKKYPRGKNLPRLSPIK